MYVNDNYGSKWVKSILSWFRNKTLDGVEYDSLIIEATLECGLRRSKLIELVNEYIETGLITVKDRKLFWINEDIKPSKIVMGKIEKGEVETKPKIKLEEKLKNYASYCKSCKADKIEPMDYETWVFANMPIENGDGDDIERM